MDNNNRPKMRIIYIVLIAAFVFVVAFQFFSNTPMNESGDKLTTGEFVDMVNKENAESVEYNASTGGLSGTYWKEGQDHSEAATEFTATYVGDDTLSELMFKHPKTKYDVVVQGNNAWLSILGTLLPIVAIVAIFWLFMSQMQGANNKQMQFGKTKAKKNAQERPNVRFTDVAGIDEAVEELQEIKDFLSDPEKFQNMGAKIPKGVLLVGPPGTGKTLLAKAVSGEAGVPFFSISGSDFVEMFVGVGASRVRDLFSQAKEAAPAIIFIDEIDAVGRHRGAGLGGGHDEREQTLNQLLVEMDGFEDNLSVILIAATNRVDILDPALLRPGRFDRQVIVDRPDLKGREQILSVHAKGKPLAATVDLSKFAKLTPGFTGADLANLMNESALLAARRGKKAITAGELNEAMERVIAGPERKSRIITDSEKKTIAYHECGHALVGHMLEHADPVHKISIIARGQALGYTLSLPSEDRFLVRRQEMYDDLAMFLAGRVAEEISCGDITTGASNDLERATKMARQMVTRYGMTDALGSQVYGDANHEVFLGRDYGATPDYSAETAHKIDEEIAKIMRTAHDVAHKILTENEEQLDLMASVLLERETVEGEAVNALLDNRWEEYLGTEDDIREREKKAEADAAKKQAEILERKAKEKAEADRLAEFGEFDGEPVEGELGSTTSARVGASSKDVSAMGIDESETEEKLIARERARALREEADKYQPFEAPEDGKPVDLESIAGLKDSDGDGADGADGASGDGSDKGDAKSTKSAKGAKGAKSAKGAKKADYSISAAPEENLDDFLKAPYEADAPTIDLGEVAEDETIDVSYIVDDETIDIGNVKDEDDKE